LKSKLSLFDDPKETKNKDKQSPHDFVLWKSQNAHQPWWHIECSAMSHAVAGEHLDLGGEDLMFPHHM
jgi:cysteinyl-tRNA synthetase